MKHDEKPIRTIAEFLTRLDTHKSTGDIVWFRGHINREWTILPSIFRKGTDHIELESAYFRKFRQNAGRFIDTRMSSDWDWFLLMQHYGTPTRLLDWSESPLVGLYFAVEEDKEHPENNVKDGILYSFLPEEFNKKYNRASLIKNDLPLIGTDTFLDDYLFFGKNSDTYPAKPVAAIAQRNSNRIFAQQGVFVVYSNQPEKLEEIGTEYLWCYSIPSADKENIRKELDLLGINKMSMFPELGNLGNHVKESM